MNAFKLITIDLDWSKVEQDLKLYQQHESSTILNPSVTWDEDYTQYGYTEHNTKIWKKIMPTDVEDSWPAELIAQLPLDNAQVTLTRQDPGQILPRHIDRFYMLQKSYPTDPRTIVRVLVYLEHWKPGHQMSFDDGMLYNWKQGDTWIWPPGTPHIAANVGLEVKWTCNVTGFVNDSKLEQLLAHI
jgi:hypothetical protein